MKVVNFYRKPVSVFVMIAFTVLLCFWANQSPAAPAAEKSSAATLENGNDESTSFIEREAPANAYKKGKKFPWLIVAAVAVVGGAALYFLVLKKKNYTLTVTVGEGVSGTPSAGATTHEKGAVVNYSYSLQGGYGDLAVTLDGAPVAASGTVTMNAGHTLAATASKTYVLTVSRGEHVTGSPASGTYTYASGANVSYSYAPASGYSDLEVKIDGAAAANAGTIAMNANHTLAANLQGANIEVNSTPAGAKIYLDKVDSGEVTPYTFYFPTAVTKSVIVRGPCGYREYDHTVSVILGQTKTLNALLAPGIYEDFKIPASSCWQPYHASAWKASEGSYKFKGSASIWAPNLYNSSFNGNYTISVKMKQRAGDSVKARGFFLGTGTSLTSNSGYLFAILLNYGIYRMTNFNLVTSSGSYTAINTGSSSAIKLGMNVWNTLKITKAGSNYACYINDTHIHSFTDGTHIPTYLVLMVEVAGNVEMDTAYVDMTAGSGIVSLSIQPLRINPLKEQANSSSGPSPIDK